MKRPIYEYTDEMMVVLLTVIAVVWVFLILV
jgi:hypothetical protein